MITQQAMATQTPTSAHSSVTPKANGTTKSVITDTTHVTDTTQVTTLPNCPAKSEGCGGTFVGGMVLGMCIPVGLYVVYFCWKRRQSRVKFQKSLSVRADE